MSFKSYKIFILKIFLQSINKKIDLQINNRMFFTILRL